MKNLTLLTALAVAFLYACGDGVAETAPAPDGMTTDESGLIVCITDPCPMPTTDRRPTTGGASGLICTHRDGAREACCRSPTGDIVPCHPGDVGPSTGR